jgi:hypothetical protein
MLVQAIEAFIESWNQNAAPFEWTKHEGAAIIEALSRSVPCSRMFNLPQRNEPTNYYCLRKRNSNRRACASTSIARKRRRTSASEERGP